MIIAVDFDGTIVKHAYPEIGEPVPGAIQVLRWAQQRGASIILWTMRSGKALEEAVDYLVGHGVVLWGVNGNPEQSTWTESPKAYAHLYVDDAALGCPLVHAPGERPWVDWVAVLDVLEKMF